MDLSKLRIVGRCADCQHYDGFRCRKMDSTGVEAAYSLASAHTWQKNVGDAGVVVDDEFGCVMWQEDQGTLNNLLERIERLEGVTYAEDN